jgi:hypothetical protein
VKVETAAGEDEGAKAILEDVLVVKGVIYGVRADLALRHCFYGFDGHIVMCLQDTLKSET